MAPSNDSPAPGLHSDLCLSRRAGSGLSQSQRGRPWLPACPNPLLCLAPDLPEFHTAVGWGCRIGGGTHPSPRALEAPRTPAASRSEGPAVPLVGSPLPPGAGCSLPFPGSPPCSPAPPGSPSHQLCPLSHQCLHRGPDGGLGGPGPGAVACPGCEGGGCTELEEEQEEGVGVAGRRLPVVP